MDIFGCLVNYIAISELAVKVYTAYKDAPGEYRHISDEVESLQIIINKAARHFESTTFDDNTRQQGQRVLRGCQNVLEDLNCLIEKYDGLASGSPSQVLRRVKLGMEDIATLRVRLISNTGLLNSFIQSCEFLEMQARLTDVLGLHRTSSRVSIKSITSFVGSINTKKAYKKFCKNLYQIGVTSEMISQKEEEVLKIFSPQNSGISGQIEDCNITDQVKLPTNMPRFRWVRSPVDFLVGPLMLAAATSGNTKRFISILEYIRNIDFEDNRGETALHKAAAGGHNGIVQLLLEKGALIEAMNTVKYTPLHLAARNGHTNIVELLLEKGALIEAMGEDKLTPLHLASWSGHTSMVELLLGKGASTEAMDDCKNTSTYYAALSGHASTLELLLRKGTSVKAIVKSYNNSPLHIAAWYGHTSTAEVLFGKGASIDAMGEYKYTPLHLAAQGGHTSMAELLLEKGASIEATSEHNYTPLHLAAQNGHTSMVQLLLEKGALIEAMNTFKVTPLHLAAGSGHTSVVGLLLQKGAQIEIGTGGLIHRTPLHLAAWGGKTCTVELLLEKGASVEARSNFRYTPLHLASTSSKAELLLRKGASITATDTGGGTPLDRAVQFGRTDVVELLKNEAAKLVAQESHA